MSDPGSGNTDAEEPRYSAQQPVEEGPVTSTDPIPAP
jgi:hypothetical protein